MLLEERDDEARKRDAGSVKRVDELRLAVRVLEAAVEAARLVVGEAAAGADFKPLLLARGPELEVVEGCKGLSPTGLLKRTGMTMREFRKANAK